MNVVRTPCRHRFTAADLHFVITVLAGGKESPGLLRLWSDATMRDRLLDEEPLFDAILDSPWHLHISHELYFYLLVRNVLLRADLDDRGVADYIASVLVELGQAAPANRQRAPLVYVVDMLEEIEKAEPYRRFALITFLGDQTLIMTGIFPDQIEHRVQRRAAPPLGYYESIGSAQYRAASDHALAQEFELVHVYGVLADGFSTVRRALNTMRDRFLTLG